MESMDYWRLCDDLSIDEAAHLVIGVDPNEFKVKPLDDLSTMPPETLARLEATTKSLISALRGESVQGVLIAVDGSPAILVDEIDTNKSRIKVESLRTWLSSRGIRTGFFFPTGTADPDYLNPNNPRYAPKLAAAVRAWQSVTDPGSRTPLQALTKWLRENAMRFGLTKDDGSHNNQGIDEVAKVANWKPGGGAPKTPNK